MTLTKYTARAIIVIAAKDQAAANAVCEAVAKGGSGTFTVPVYDATDALAGYLCNWQMLPSEATALKDGLTKAKIVPLRWADCDHWDPQKSTVSGDTVTRSLGLKTDSTAAAVQFARAMGLPSITVPTVPVTERAVVAYRWKKAIVRWWLARFWAWLMSLVRKAFR